jgi:hypothetical protein
MTNIREIMSGLAAREDELREGRFLSPCVGGRVHVRGLLYSFTPANAAKLLAESEIVIDAFDNSGSRQAVRDYRLRARLPCLHAGLAGDYSDVIWKEIYRVPSESQDDVCDYKLANLAMLTAALACETIVAYAASGRAGRRRCAISLSGLSHLTDFKHASQALQRPLPGVHREQALYELRAAGFLACLP